MIRNFQIPLLRLDRVCLVALVFSAHASVWAHGEGDDPLPVDVGWSAQARVALRAAELRGDLPSVAMAGFLSPGGAGDALQAEALEHASLAASWRFTPQWGARVQLAQHDGDDLELEDAWVQWRHDTDRGDAWWLNLGRMTPAQGAVLANAGSFDDFALAPLAQTLAWGHPTGEDGVQASWRGSRGEVDLSLDFGLWRGHNFPSSGAGDWAPSLRLGLQRGPWSLNGVWLRHEVVGRGRAIVTNVGHSHTQPVCDTALQEVLCFSGASELRGASVQWDGMRSTLDVPVRLSAAGWQRLEWGDLLSANGQVDYRGDAQGLWLEAAWVPRAQWLVSARLERAQMDAGLSGLGANLLAQEAGFDDYQVLRRDSVSLAYRHRSWSRWVLALGREQAGAQGGHSFAALRWMLSWGRSDRD